MAVYLRWLRHTAYGQDPIGRAVAGGRVPGFTPAPVIGDTVIMRLAGEVNGTRFDFTREFDYATLYRSPDLPSSSPIYRQLLRARLDDLVSEITNIVWRDIHQGNATSGITGHNIPAGTSHP